MLKQAIDPVASERNENKENINLPSGSSVCPATKIPQILRKIYCQTLLILLNQMRV